MPRNRSREATIDTGCLIALQHLGLFAQLSLVFDRVYIPRRVREEATFLAVLEEAARWSRLERVGPGDGRGEVVEDQYVRMSNHRIAVAVGTDRYQEWWVQNRQRRTQKEIAAAKHGRAAD